MEGRDGDRTGVDVGAEVRRADREALALRRVEGQLAREQSGVCGGAIETRHVGLRGAEADAALDDPEEVEVLDVAGDLDDAARQRQVGCAETLLRPVERTRVRTGGRVDLDHPVLHVTVDARSVQCAVQALRVEAEPALATAVTPSSLEAQVGDGSVDLTRICLRGVDQERHVDDERLHLRVADEADALPE